MANAAKWKEKMLRNSQNAGQDWLDGIRNPRRNPKEAALKAVGKYKQRVQESLTKGSYEKGIQAMDVTQMIATAEAIGPAGYVQGITARKGKIEAAIDKLAPKVEALSNKIQSMPQDTDQQREARMLENLRGMRNIKG